MLHVRGDEHESRGVLSEAALRGGLAGALAVSGRGEVFVLRGQPGTRGALVRGECMGAPRWWSGVVRPSCR